MKNILTKKDSTKNVVVEVFFLKKNDQGIKEKYKCAGVLIEEKDDYILLGFSSVNDLLIDSLKINKEDVLKVSRISSKDIVKLN